MRTAFTDSSTTEAYTGASLHRTITLPLLIIIILFGAWLRMDATTQDVRFHSDEALYSTYARNAAVYGYWMLDGPLDKPPLSIYANALAMHFTATYTTDSGVLDVPVRQGEFASKLPNLFAGIISIVLVYAIARRLFSPEIALFSTLLMSVSPYGVAYSASAFTDALMLVLMLASWRSALNQHPAWSGLWLALSFWAKPQGLLYLPLVVVFIMLNLPALRQNQLRLNARARDQFLRFVFALGVSIGLLLLWDAIRPETSLFTLGSINISQGRAFTPPDEWIPRLQAWLQHGDNLFGHAIFTLVVVVFGIITAFYRRNWLSMGILAMSVGFFVLHWIPATWTFDRYLLPLVPLFALLAGRGLILINTKLTVYHKPVLAVFAVIILLNAGVTHDPRADAFRGTSEDALIDLANYINNQHLGAIIYDRWMGWEMGYYVGAWSDKRRVYYPAPHTQASDALLNPDPAPRYVIAPENREGTRWITHFERVGFVACIGYQQDGFTVFTLTPPYQVGLADYLPGIGQVWGASIVESSLHDPVWCDDADAS